jgi:hypothetical protein
VGRLLSEDVTSQEWEIEPHNKSVIPITKIWCLSGNFRSASAHLFRCKMKVPHHLWSINLRRLLSVASRLVHCTLLVLALSPLICAQDRSGELRLVVTDSQGAALAAHGLLVSEASRFELSFATAPTGEYVAKELPLGTYHLTIEHSGFAPYSSAVEIRSPLPQKMTVALSVAPVA